MLANEKHIHGFIKRFNITFHKIVDVIIILVYQYDLPIKYNN